MSEQTASPPENLSSEQLHALFDILSHHETYSELENFKSEHAVSQFGHPYSSVTHIQAPSIDNVTSGFGGFSLWGRSSNTSASPSSSLAASGTQTPAKVADPADDSDDVVSTSPLLQMLLAKFILPLPGVVDLPRDFWRVRAQGLLHRLGKAELSESYDKGAMGTRKTLATGASVIMENVGRGLLGGAVRTSEETNQSASQYDLTQAHDLIRGWDYMVDQLVYGNFNDSLFEHFAKTEDLDSHSPTIRAAVEYAIFHLSTLFHAIFIKSPEGQYLLKLMENVNNLIPYKMIGQTLRIGNAATMISGMMRLLLAKLSVTGVTNWVGLTASADDGMNLLQRIISLVLSWDASEFKKIVDKIEKAKGGPTPEMLKTIKEYVRKHRKEHDLVREASVKIQQSIIIAIFNSTNPELAASISETQHTQCLEYYSALLSVQDRERIAAALTRETPDLFTQLVKDGVAACEPMIRSVHERVDLREHLDGLQDFVSDFIKTSTPKRGGTVGVEDYVALLRRSRPVLHHWIHAIASKCPDIWEEIRVWCNNSLQAFRKESSQSSGRGPAAVSVDHKLNELYRTMDDSTKDQVISAIDAHISYLSTLKAISAAKLQYIITMSIGSKPDETNEGPGAYLVRWQSLLDKTLITPADASQMSTLRHGKDVRHATTMGKIGLGGNKNLESRHDFGPEAPDVSIVTKELGSSFRDLVREISIAREAVDKQ